MSTVLSFKRHFHFLGVRRWFCEKYGHSQRLLKGNTGDFCSRCGDRV